MGVTQLYLCEMEIKAPFGHIDKYQRLSSYLGIPVHALVTDDCSLIPTSFFDKYLPRPYTHVSSEGKQRLGRSGEDLVFELERNRLEAVNPSLAKLVLPFYKLRYRPGYDSDIGTTSNIYTHLDYSNKVSSANAIMSAYPNTIRVGAIGQ